MKKIFYFIYLFVITTSSVFAQSILSKTTDSGDITISPYPFNVTDQITITINSNNSCNSLSSETLYIHSGVGTGANQAEAWKYVVGNWGQDDGVGKLTNNGNGTHSITLTPKTYYSIPDGQESTIKGMGMVIRNANGSVKWKYLNDANSCSDADYFIGVGSFQLTINSPSVVAGGTLTKTVGDNILIDVSSSESADWSIKEAGNEIHSATASTSISHTVTVAQTTTYTVEANNGSEIKTFSFSVLVNSIPTVEALPTGIRDGINYDPNDATKVTLVLHAPNKSNIYVKGDFSNWMLESKYQMKMTHADQSNENIRYWITLDNLQSGEEYAFQYVVDGERNIADPYTTKVLDQWNDGYISDEIYPNLKKYPVGMTEGIVSVFQTAQVPYSWSVPNFTKPEKKDLIIYELLVRDFVYEHSYQSLLDTLDYLEKLNVNAIELMPINEFEGNESWGYNPSFMFALDKYYGTRDKLKQFIDEAHSRGIAVIIDIVMNHAFGQSPFVNLYDWHSADQIIMDEPTPWFNSSSPNPTYKWGADFNHESVHTQALLDSVNAFWINEYKVDGFRFDFTKGFTNTAGDGWNYDAARIAILKRMYDHIESISPGSYVILEHLAAATEEKELAEYGMMLWGNMVHNFTQAAMGYIGQQDELGWASHITRGWSEPNLISYASSHDEERMAYKLKTYGKEVLGGYSTRDPQTSMERMQLAYLFLFAIPGPKMIWQFDEIGYDYSIDYNGRVGNKPLVWDYLYDIYRARVYNTIKTILMLRKTEPAFSTSTYTLNLDNGAIKTITFEHSDMDMVLVGNFDVSYKTATIQFPQAGTWHEYFSGTSNDLPISFNVSMAPGTFKLYTSKQLEKPNLDANVSLSIDEVSYDKNQSSTAINVYPNPVKGQAYIAYSISSNSNVRVDIYDMNGSIVKNYDFTNQASGTHTLNWTVENNVKSGIYFVRISTGLESLTRKIIVE